MLWRFCAPRFWPVWIGLGLLRLLALLPYRVQMSLGRGLGRLAHHFARRERHTAAVNLRLALPGLSDGERARLQRRHFESLGCAIFETALAWWASDKRLRTLVALALRPIEALEAATIVNARYLGLERDLGSIEPGKLADLVVLEADPLADIRNSTKIRHVMKDGRLYDAETLDEVWPKPKAYGPRRWTLEK